MYTPFPKLLKYYVEPSFRCLLWGYRSIPIHPVIPIHPLYIRGSIILNHLPNHICILKGFPSVDPGQRDYI